ncbi:MAG: hypothetical protein U9Q15_04130 [Patescibacteria group bacterium]|nr:hypothetical protein [Patescibacteria group bacterium]
MPLSQNEISQQIYRKNYSALSTEEKSSVDKVVQNDRALEALQYAQNNRLSTEQFADHARSQGMSGLGGDGAGRTGALQQRQQNI